MTSLLAISGSPSADSRTALVVDRVVRHLSHAGYRTSHLAVRDLPAADLLAGRVTGPALRGALDEVAAADGLVVATPVYKASYTGLLKAFLDLLPQSGLAGKTVLPLATGGSLAHVLTLDYALRPVLSALGARHIVPGCFLLDSAVERLGQGAVRLEPETEIRLLQAVDGFTDALAARAPLATAAS
ncbi:FMN reductase (NADPH) [Streptomyces agglomeratus]|uniref:FMN reductase (NADPH) n=1 Tax=Streptomyces agglomeratus TaxID=285458 RepID=A0A1E5P252_9ACTN|nr:NADPH-dependent FMN reductase [Streptomyces agglomeratus]OEJ23638.1 FMN reductase (NADPH) [Streptomyces agglomeratus]OEJ43230.1 FMN reductase (NADPH) [Streptomyces agglomeratus]OEJ54849.1 FMN reductase (NADPH) [Streptomyces agglomeratus]OEJ62220.1 FMN reductase (NADPH) [Streptomyces agglomeratus]